MTELPPRFRRLQLGAGHRPLPPFLRALRCLVVAAAALLGVAPAGAEPHFSARTGLSCARCHSSPLGGGKRTAYGTLYAHTSLPMTYSAPTSSLPARKPGGGEGWITTALATGEVTSWMALGADLRLANRTTFDEETTNSFSTSAATLYLELRPLPDRVLLYLDQSFGDGGANLREAWGLVRGPWSLYLRGGRILPPFGLRVVDDGAYTRRATGANFANADLGFELGLDRGPLFVAVALTNGSFSGEDNDTLKALYGLAELNLGRLRLGLSGAYNPTEDGCRAMTGLFVSLGLGRLVLMGEADYISQRPADSNRWGHQLAGLVEVDLLITRGLSLRLGYDVHDADLELTQDRRQRFRFGLDFFPLRMVALRLYYIHKQAETTRPADEADRLEVTLHVFL